MTAEGFAVIEGLLEHAWKGEWSPAKADAYRTLLEPYPAQAVVAALHKLIAGGVPFTPTVPEIVATLHHDPGVPTWEEVERCVFDHGAPIEHPLFEAFVVRNERALALAPVHDPDHGHLERERWRQRWLEFVGAYADRDRHALAAAAVPRAQLGPRRVGPLAFLQGARELEAGER